jgi:ABC-type Fe3+-hydroxamate transport system, periplasmic component
MLELKSSSTWYVPGGNSTVAKLIHDAGANYIFKDDKHNGSIPMSFETVFEKGENADFWLIKYNQVKDKSYNELKEEYSPYSNFRPFKTRNIYGCNTNFIPYYEESPFHPQLLLADYIKIFHPQLLKEHKLKYFSKLAE